MNMESWQAFWGLVMEVWNTVFLGVSVGRVLLALGLVLFFLLIRRVVTWLVIANLKRIVVKTDNLVDDKAVEALQKPIEFVPVIMALYFGTAVLQLGEPYVFIVDNLVKSLVAIVIFWAIYNVAVPLSELMNKLETVLTASMIDWAVRSMRWLVIFVGAVAVLEIWGIQVAPLIAGLGLFGVAVALGAQDMFKNLIAGILILVERRFKQGDWIRVDGVVEGTVDRIGFRSTRVRRFDKAPVAVPNTELSDNPVTNFSEMTHRRIYWVIGVEYRTTVDQLREIRDGIEDYISTNEDFAQPPEVSRFVRIDAFSDSSIDIMIYTFTKTTNWGQWLQIKEEFAYAIKGIVEGAGSGFAFPSKSIYIEHIAGERPEIFVPPGESD